MKHKLSVVIDGPTANMFASRVIEDARALRPPTGDFQQPVQFAAKRVFLHLEPASRTERDNPVRIVIEGSAYELIGRERHLLQPPQEMIEFGVTDIGDYRIEVDATWESEARDFAEALWLSISKRWNSTPPLAQLHNTLTESGIWCNYPAEEMARAITQWLESLNRPDLKWKSRMILNFGAIGMDFALQLEDLSTKQTGECHFSVRQWSKFDVTSIYLQPIFASNHAVAGLQHSFVREIEEFVVGQLDQVRRDTSIIDRLPVAPQLEQVQNSSADLPTAAASPEAPASQDTLEAARIINLTHLDNLWRISRGSTEIALFNKANGFWFLSYLL